MLSVTCHGHIWRVLCTVRYGHATLLATASERTVHFRPRDACVPANSTCHPHSHHHRLVLHPSLHRRRLDRFVVLCPSSPLSSHLKCHTIRPRSPAKCTPLRQSSFQRHTRRARHLASRALARDHILLDLGFTVYRIVQDSFVRSSPLFRLEPLLCLFYLPFLLSHRTWDDTAPFTRSSVLVYNHLCWPQPGERSIQNPINAIDPFLFSFACHGRLKLSLRLVTIPFACSRPFGRAATPLSSPTRVCELASDLKNYPSILHSVGLPPALQYLSELFNKPDGLVKNAVQVPMRTVDQAPNHCKVIIGSESDSLLQS